MRPTSCELRSARHSSSVRTCIEMSSGTPTTIAPSVGRRPPATAGRSCGEPSPLRPLAGISAIRLREVIRNLEIGERLFVSPKTTDTYRSRIMSKLDIHRRSELVDYALGPRPDGIGLPKDPREGAERRSRELYPAAIVAGKEA